MCCHSLNLLASTVPSLKDDLKSLLINILIYPPALPQSIHTSSHENHLCPHPSAPSVLRCLSLLIPAEEGHEDTHNKDATETHSSSLPEVLTVLARCLTFLAHPCDSSHSLGINTLTFLQNYAANLDSSLASVYSEKIPPLIKTLK
ncbi:hypothetical protein J437_LFUL006614, partial [Ladona fulva]